MKNNSNIYDIDGELIRRFDDVHRFTALEATKINEKYTQKIQNLREKKELTKEEQKQLKAYETYCKNLQHYIFVEMQGMSKKEIDEYYKAIIPENLTKTDKEDIENAINNLKNDIETGSNTEDKVQTESAEDIKDNTDEILGDDVPVRRESCDIPEERSISQDDLLVERGNVTNNMDEYVDYEEV